MRHAARPSVARNVDPFRGILAASLAEFPRLSSVRLFEASDLGYLRDSRYFWNEYQARWPWKRRARRPQPA